MFIPLKLFLTKNLWKKSNPSLLNNYIPFYYDFELKQKVLMKAVIFMQKILDNQYKIIFLCNKDNHSELFTFFQMKVLRNSFFA